MTNSKLGRDHLIQAEARKEFVNISFQKELWSVVVRASQEIVELSLKGALRFVGVEPPKWHDVGEVLEKESSRFPGWFQLEIPFCRDASSVLREKRESSFYGDSDSDIPSSEMFSEHDAQEAKAQAERILSLCQRLFTQALPR